MFEPPCQVVVAVRHEGKQPGGGVVGEGSGLAGREYDHGCLDACCRVVVQQEGQGRVGQGRVGQGRVGQGRAGQGITGSTT